MYYLAINNGTEGWSLRAFDTLEALTLEITQGGTYSEFRIFKELELKIVEPKEG